MNRDQLKAELRGKRALLADDESSVRSVLRMLLKLLGLEVTEANDGLHALEFYRREKFDFVLTDYSMPKMCGDVLAREIKKLNPAQRIVMVSGFASQLLEGGRLPAGIDALLPKPFTIEQLADALA